MPYLAHLQHLAHEHHQGHPLGGVEGGWVAEAAIAPHEVDKQAEAGVGPQGGAIGANQGGGQRLGAHVATAEVEQQVLGIANALEIILADARPQEVGRGEIGRGAKAFDRRMETGNKFFYHRADISR